MPQSPQHVLVLGSGNFGTALAYHLSSLNDTVRLWSRDKTITDSINETHKNPRYLKDLVLPNNMVGIGPEFPEDVLEQTQVILCCIPTQHLRKILHTIRPLVKENHLLIFANKGIEMSTLLLPCDIIKEELGEVIGGNAVFLSGPSFAIEVVQQQPTCVTVASTSSERAKWAQRTFHSKIFRVYTASDVIGVELAGSIKNVIAIASGISSGLGYQMNPRAALVTRGLSEMGRLSVKLGGDPLTLLTLAGIGDLFLTCTSEKSRNFTVGYRLGQGENLQQIVESLGSIAEGVPTTKAAHDLAEKLGLRLPIIEAVYKVLYQDMKCQDALSELLDVVTAEEHLFNN